jgi:hypothetical protein
MHNAQMLNCPQVADGGNAPTMHASGFAGCVLGR